MAQCKGSNIVSLEQIKWSKKRWKKQKALKAQKLISITKTFLGWQVLDIPAVKNLRLANVNRQTLRFNNTVRSDIKINKWYSVKVAVDE